LRPDPARARRSISASAAYTTALLFTKFGVLPWFGMLGGGVISALIAMALGLSLLPAARALFRHRDHRDRRNRAALVPRTGIGPAARAGIDIPWRGDSWLKFQSPAAKLALLLFRAGARRHRLVRDLGLGRFQMGYWWRR